MLALVSMQGALTMVLQVQRDLSAAESACLIMPSLSAFSKYTLSCCAQSSLNLPYYCPCTLHAD